MLFNHTERWPFACGCDHATCSSSVKQWFLSQGSTPQNWLRVYLGLAAALVRVRTSKTARMHRVFVHLKRAVASVRARDEYRVEVVDLGA